MSVIDWLNNNPGGASVVGSLVGATASALFAVLGWLGGKVAGKKAAQKKIAPLEALVQQQAEQINNFNATLVQQAEKIATVTAHSIDTFKM
ncbi:MAG: hypothetical protein FWH26_04045 [Oscillospiraceae bacterium]|nr:hypothetical protein [Oscillospiraceae bacterium]